MSSHNKLFFLPFLLLFSLCLPAIALADVELPNIFSDHMVLQRSQANKLWGRAEPKEEILVSIAEQTHETTADDQGLWSVMLDPLPAGGPHELVVAGDNEIVLRDVLVGEVWICSGQSNMEWSVRNTDDADLVAAGANFPKIRMINFPNVGQQEPLFTHPKSSWMVCSPKTVGGFSAVGYFFGRQLHDTLQVPIGLVNNAWGGSSAEAWVDRKQLEADGSYDSLLKRWAKKEQLLESLTAKSDLDEEQKQRVKELQDEMVNRHRPGNIYNGVLKTHLGYGIRGAIWYQGESNASRAYQYRRLFPKMITTWREEWGQGEFPFYWVQLADFREEKSQPSMSDWAELREAQTMALSALPNAGQAVIIDVGEGKDIHPRNKATVGQRLARWALAKQYGVDIAYHSPQIKSMEAVGDRIVLTFNHVNGGWRPFDVNKPVGFAIAGADKKFVWADAKILENGRIEVSSSEVPEPVAVRYAWADNPVCNMFDNVGLPLTPFRTDDWPGVTVDRE